MSEVMISEGTLDAIAILTSLSISVALVTTYLVFKTKLDRTDDSVQTKFTGRYWDTVRQTLIWNSLFVLLVCFIVLFAKIPPEYLLWETTLDAVPTALGTGVLLALVLIVVQQLFYLVAYRFGYEQDMTYVELLTPDTRDEWILHFGVFLPVVAVYEELLYRVGLVALAYTTYGVDTWTLVVVSAVLFGLVHRHQNWTGVALTTIIGLILGAAYLWTGSLLTVIIAHLFKNILVFAIYAHRRTEPSTDVHPI